nr:hypothetical protein [Hepelivirales sp.]
MTANCNCDYYLSLPSYSTGFYSDKGFLGRISAYVHSNLKCIPELSDLTEFDVDCTGRRTPRDRYEYLLKLVHMHNIHLVHRQVHIIYTLAPVP